MTTDFGLQRRIAAFHGADDVAHGPPHSRRAIERAHGQVGERARLRREVAVDLVRRRLEIQPGTERALNQVAGEEEHRNPEIFGLRLAQPPAEPIGGRPMVGVVDDEDGLRAVFSRHLDLPHHRRMHRVRLSFERASRVVLLRLVRENQHGFVGCVDARVVVVAKRRRGNAVTGKDHGQGFRSGRRTARRRHDLVVASHVELHRGSTRLQRHRVARIDRHPGRHVESLKERAAIARGLEAGLAEFRGDIFGRAFEAAAAVSTPFEIVRREKLHVLQVGLRIDAARIRLQGDGTECGDKQTN